MNTAPHADVPDGTTFTLAFATGDAVLDELRAFAVRHDLRASHFTGLGAFAEATLAFYDLEAKEYRPIEVDEQTEVASFTGNVAVYEDEPRLHVHAVLARRDGSTVGGHLLSATVRPTLEVTLTEKPGTLQRRYDEASGLPLLNLS
jgi:hypothetical protein